MADENQASTKYLELVGIIEAAENSAHKIDVSFIDLSDPAFEAASSQQSPSYEDLVAVIEEIETGKHVVHQPATQQKAAPQPQRQPQPQQAQAPPQAPPQAAPPTTPPAEAQRAEAGRELGTVAQRLASAMPRIKEMRRRRINVKDLVLPNLSTADQISELERIIEGLRENVFDGEHLEIVAQEVFGLDQVVAGEKKSKKKPVAISELDMSLQAVRDQRLAQAVSILNGNGAG